MLRQKLMAAAFVAGQAVLLGAVTGEPLVPLTAIGVALAGIFMGDRWTISRRQWLFTTLTAAVVLAVKGQMIPVEIDSAAVLYVAPLGFTLLVCEILLFVQAIGSFRRTPAGNLPDMYSVFGLLFLLFLCNHSIPLVEQDFYFMTIIAAVGLMALLRLTIDLDQLDRTAVLNGGVFLAIALTAWVFLAGWTYALPRTQIWLSQSLSVSPTERRDVATSYVQRATLFNIADSQLREPDGVALRVYTNRTPGYLRGRAFDYFAKGRWDNGRQSRWNSINPTPRIPDSLPVLPAELARFQPRNVFNLAPRSSGPWTKLEIHNDPERGNVFFVPSNAAYMMAKAVVIRTDSNDTIRDGISATAPYTAYVGERTRDPRPSLRRQQELVTPPIGVDPRVEAVAQRILDRRPTDSKKIQAVQAFFLNNYKYSLDGFDAPINMDLLSYFILHRPPAHCEFFATAAAVMLRYGGVPCRYVTGYVVTELEPEYSDYWIGRNRNAHAWVEAYNRDTQQWVIVEATPGISVGVETVEIEQTITGNEVTATTGLSFSDSWSTFASRVLAIMAKNFLSLALAGLAIVTILGVLLKIRNRQPLDPATAAQRHNRALLRTLSRRLARRKLTRSTSETLHQFAKRVQAAAEKEAWLEVAAQWCSNYADQLYGPAETFEILDPCPAPPRRARARQQPQHQP
ncbi:transglutaminase family protein [Lignipirellula cremea]|uniref:Protein-glutamine gamma-glutamyltransferase n=1 Tax=Lignipirellula cremea TaxID=2528010 RepID=A0A518DME9_9BACT|nr:transglutaminase domain-containing protein [Lignipirellula cremea]QDU93002.1 Protein-glutamine gamma-glutamyltransferase [Lignipirellula cremea]